MPSWIAKKEKGRGGGGREEMAAGFVHLRIVENACHSVFPEEQLHNAITLD